MNKFTILLLILSNFIFAQQDSLVNGRIIIENDLYNHVTITNLCTKKYCTTNEDGYFTITAKIGDTLFCGALHLNVVRYKVEKKDFNNTIVLIKMQPKTHEIEKVMITKTNLTAESLGLVPKGQKKYTVAERRLHAGTSGFGIGGLINAITGETKILKRNVETERKQMLMDKILSIFDTEIFTETLKIPKENLNGFLFYLVEQKDTKEMFKTKDKGKQLFFLIENAVLYLKILEVSNHK